MNRLNKTVLKIDSIKSISFVLHVQINACILIVLTSCQISTFSVWNVTFITSIVYKEHPLSIHIMLYNHAFNKITSMFHLTALLEYVTALLEYMDLCICTWCIPADYF